MTSAEAAAAIVKRWMVLWPGKSGNVPFSSDNNVVPQASPHARVAVVSLDSDQTTLGPPGNRKWERRGMIDVRLVGPIKEGRKDLDRLAQYVREIYEGVRFAQSARDGGIVTYATSVRELRRDRDAPQLWILGVVTPFHHLETR